MKCKFCREFTNNEYCDTCESKRLKIANVLNMSDFRELSLKRLLTVKNAITIRSVYK